MKLTCIVYTVHATYILDAHGERHTYIYIFTYIHTCIHKYTHTHIYTHTFTRIRQTDYVWPLTYSDRSANCT